MDKQASTITTAVLRRVVLSVSLIVIAAWILAEHWSVVSNSLRVARTARVGWLGVSLLLMTATFCIAAAIYSVLALRSLRYRQTILVEYAAAFVNRLLPSGLGGLGLHGVYLYKQKHTAAEATIVVSVNNLIGMVAHMLLLAGVIIGRPTVFSQLVSGKHVALSWKFGIVGVLFVIMLMMLPIVRRRISQFASNMLVSIHAFKTYKFVEALGLATVLTGTYTGILYAVACSLGLEIAPVQIFIIFSLGMFAATATPTPGGLVGAEAGLFAGFIAYGASDVSAGAAVLLYRLITYWLPLPLGLFALFVARRRRLV